MPKQEPTPTSERITKSYTLPANLVRLIGYFRIDRGLRSHSHAVEHLLQAGLDAEEARAKAEKKGKAA